MAAWAKPRSDVEGSVIETSYIAGGGGGVGGGGSGSGREVEVCEV